MATRPPSLNSLFHHVTIQAPVPQQLYAAALYPLLCHSCHRHIPCPLARFSQASPCILFDQNPHPPPSQGCQALQMQVLLGEDLQEEHLQGAQLEEPSGSPQQVLHRATTSLLTQGSWGQEPPGPTTGCKGLRRPGGSTLRSRACRLLPSAAHAPLPRLGHLHPAPTAFCVGPSCFSVSNHRPRPPPPRRGKGKAPGGAARRQRGAERRHLLQAGRAGGGADAPGRAKA